MMPTEIERKFIVASGGWRTLLGLGKQLRQGYLCVATQITQPEVRVRCTTDRGFITIKSAGSLTRSEFEYEIPLVDAEFLISCFCSGKVLEKTRHSVEFGGLVWEVDEYFGSHRGLVLAEVELKEATQEVPLPPWVGKEVTDDPRFKNAYLATHPEFRWRE